MSQYSSHNINSFNTVNVSNNFIAADDRSNILAWLSPLDPKSRHQDIQDRRAENIGEWLLRTEEFRSWQAGAGEGKSNEAVLFCYGHPGVGKTYISSLAIDTLCDQAGEQNATVACFYFDFAVQKEQSPASTMGALLKQVVGGLEEIPEEILHTYQKQKKALGGRGPRLSDIVKMLQTASSKEPTFICIDALDECVPEYRVKFLDSLNKILQQSPATRVFMTGRPHIQPDITRRLAGRVTSLPITTKRDDIIRYLHSRLEEDTIPDAMDSSLEAEILKKIPEDVSEIFLLVKLNIDVVLRETTIHRRRQKLSAMTDGLGLGDAYGTTLDRIRRQSEEKARLGMSALMWISHAERPLKADDLCHALAVEIGSPNLNTDNVPSIATLLACCQGLVVVEQEATTVRLVHFTLQEYLRAHPSLFGAAHSTMAETCLSYLNSQRIKAIPTGPSPDLQDTPFLEYSSVYWGVHAKRDLSDCAKQLALKLFEDYNSHISTKILLNAQNIWGVDVDKFSGFGGLHCVSFFGIIEIVDSLVEMEGCDINQMDFTGSTPLHWAARNGHEGVVKIFLARDGVNPEKPNNKGLTPLWWAAYNGHEGVVKMLLGRDDVNPDKSDNDGLTPLMCASYCGHEGVVKILLGRDDVNPDKPDNNGQTPLLCAATGGHEAVVKMLLERDGVSPDKPNNDDQTPFLCAATGGHEAVVKILLERDDVNPDRPDGKGQTPLYCAAYFGHEGVVKILLGRDDVNPDKPNNNGRTPLWCAAHQGNEEVVKILLGRDDVNPDKPDNNGGTPLWWAALKGHEGVVKILLERDNVGPDKPDNDGRTPLWCAAWDGHEEVVKILLGRDDINPNKPDKDGQTPLHRAALNGHQVAVEMLLRRRDVNPDNPDNGGQTPLYLAAWYGHQGVVEVLLGQDEVNPDTPENGGHTPLRSAARCGHEGVVKILLGREGVNPDKSNHYGQTPLSGAAMDGHEAVVKILLGLAGVNPDKPDESGRTPLWWAAENGHEGVVKILLARGDVNPDQLDKYGKTPLFYAVKNGHNGVIALLQPPESAISGLA